MRSAEPLHIDLEEIRRIERAIASKTESLARGEAEGHRATGAMLHGIGLNYRPMWNRKNKIVAVYRCVPVRYDDATGDVFDSYVLSRPDDSVQRAILDTLVLHRGAATAMRLESEAKGAVPHICLPVHASTLLARERLLPFLAECASLPEGVEKHLTFEVIDAAEYVGRSQVMPAVQKLREFARGLIVQLPLETFDVSFWRSAGFSGVAADIRGRADTEAGLITAMEQFAFTAETAKLASYVHGTPTLAVTVAAVAAGFTFVGAGLVQRDTGPVAVRRYTLTDLYGECA